MAQLPEIKAEVNREPERDKKKAGLFARLFGGGTGGGAMGSGGFGGLGSAAAGGGLLATKAGLMALILVGSTVAGGIGLVGYRLFGPGQDQGNSDNLSVFAPKPKEDPNAAAAKGAAGKDGGSTSLQYLSQANSEPKPADTAASAAPKDETAANAANGSASSGPLNAAGDTGNGVSKAMPKPASKLGAFAGFGSSSGGGGVGASASTSNTRVAGADANAHNGSLTAMTHGKGVAGGTSRGIAGRSFKGGIGQALGALADNKGATTSYGAGHTYDGSTAASGSNIGPDGGQIGAGGAPGTAAGGAQPKSLPNAANDTNTSQPPPTPTSVDAAPWQHAIQDAQMLIAAAIALLLIASLCSKTVYGHIVTIMVAAVVAMIGGLVIALGAQIAGGQFGQKLQGGMLAAAGIGLEVAAAAALLGGQDPKAGTSATNATTTTTTAPGATAGSTVTTATTTPGTAATAATPATDGMGAATDGTAQTGGSGGMFSGVNPFVLIGGGLGLVGLAGTMMMPPPKLPTSDYPNGTPPDTHWFGYNVPPSTAALKKMVA